MILSNFPDSQTLTMQQEALKRVRDMQIRARQSVEQSNTFPETYGRQATLARGTAPTLQPQQFQSQPSSQAQPPYPPASPFIPQPPFQQRPPQQNMPPQGNAPHPPPQQNMPPQGNGQHPPPQQNMPPQGNAPHPPPQQNMPPQGQQRQSGFSQPNNILSHLFGGGRQSGPQNQGGQRGNAPGTNQSATRTGGSGLLDLLRRQGLGDSVSGLGETLQNTISSVSEPISGLLDSFGIDGEKLIILLVMWAIFNEHKDNKMLLMALGYLLL